VTLSSLCSLLASSEPLHFDSAMSYSSTCALTLLALSWSSLVAGQGLRGSVQKPTAAPASDSVASESKQPAPADEIKELKQAAAADAIKPLESEQSAPIGEVIAEVPKKAGDPEQPAPIGEVKAEEPKQPVPVFNTVTGLIERETTTRAPMMRREDPVQPTISRFNADGTLMRKEPLPASRKVLIEVTDTGEIEELLEVSDEEYFKMQEGAEAVEAVGDATIQWGAPQKDVPTAEEEARDAGVLEEVLPPSKEPQDLKRLLLKKVSSRIS